MDRKNDGKMYNVGMAATRKKTTVYLDPDLLRAVKVLAASSGRHDYEVVEEALRQYLGSSQVEANRQALRELIDEVHSQSDLTDEEALELAYSELRAVRRERR